MSKNILAFIEAKDGKFRNSSFEVASEAGNLAKELGSELILLAVGNGLSAEAKSLEKYCSGKFLYAELSELNGLCKDSNIIYSPSAIAKVISELAAKNNAGIIMLSATSLGKDLAGRIAVKTDSAVFNDCTELKIENGSVFATRPVYAGKSLTVIKSNSDKIVISIRPNVFKPSEIEGGKLETEKLDLSTLNIGDSDFTSIVKELIVSNEKLDVAEADRIVSGGRGLKEPENFKIIEELASVIGGATGASRAVVDAGWRPHSEQVGQTGKTVSPSLYIACGISGAIQHLAGMSSSKCIVAINKDKDAPIFQAADYGIVGDVFEIVPALTEEFKKILAK